MNDMFSNRKATLRNISTQLTNRASRAIRCNMGNKIFVLLPVAVLGLSGCVQVSAPDKPIVINLNIAIRQEILYKLDAASKKVIDENPEIF
jgi:YnbE-like lipoprotein